MSKTHDIPGRYVDPRLVPKAPMPKAEFGWWTNFTMMLHGFGKPHIITAQSHPELYAAFVNMAARNGIEPPTLYFVESRTSNAAALSKDRVIITSKLLEMVTVEEATAVLGHELGHVKHIDKHFGMRLIPIATGLAGAEAAQYGFRKSGLGIKTTERDAVAIIGGERIPAKVVTTQPRLWSSIAIWFLGWDIGQGIGGQFGVKPAELEADREGAKISGHPEHLASALKKLHKDRTGNPLFFWRKFTSGYPSMEQRVSELEKLSPVSPEPPASNQSAPSLVINAAQHEGRKESAGLSLPFPIS